MPALADRTQRKLVFSLLFCVFSGMFYLSWMRWGNLFVDTFYDQWVYHKIISGKVIYKDIYYCYGFLPVYVGAFFYRIFGETLYASVIFGTIVSVLSTTLVYRISRLFLGRFISCLLAAHLVVLLLFNGNSDMFNFILPYSSSVTLAIVFVLSALYFFLKFILTKNGSFLYILAISLAIVFLSRYELGFLVTLALGVVALAWWRLRHDRRLILAVTLGVVTGALGYVLFIFGNHIYLGFKMSVGGFFMSLGKDNYFHLRMSGLAYPVRSFVYAFKHFFFQAVIVLLLFFTARTVNFKKNMIVAFVALPLVIFLSIRWMGFPYYGIYSSLPVILAAGSILILYRFFCNTHKFDFSVNLALLTAFLVAIAVGLRIILNFSIVHYGFVLGIPGLIAYYLFWFRIIPDFVIHSEPVRRNYIYSVAIFFIFLNIPIFATGAAHYLQKTVKIESPHGYIFSLPDESAVCFRQAVDYMKTVVPKAATLVVLPEGVGINYFSDHDNPLYITTYIPPAIDVIGGQDKLIADLASYKVDYIAIAARGTSEYRFVSFGVDYGARVDNWIKEHYALEKVFGSYPFAGSHFGVALYRRKG